VSSGDQGLAEGTGHEAVYNEGLEEQWMRLKQSACSGWAEGGMEGCRRWWVENAAGRVSSEAAQT
jgi:hypothetical protein